MAYTVNLNNHQLLAIANQGDQTIITLTSSSPGQQQSQSNSFITGVWTNPPQLYKKESGWVLQIEGNGKKSFVLINSNSISTLNTPPSLQQKIQLETAEDSNINQNPINFKPMQPMQPMKMGNMSMDMNDMSMKMGNMAMSMGKKAQSSAKKSFCTQCGQEAKFGDRFCGNCGNKLADL